MWRRIWAITQKEFIQFVRNRTMLIAFIIAAPLEIVLFAVAIHTDVQHIPMVVADQSLSQASQSYLQAFTDSGAFDIVSSVSSQADATRAIDQGRASIGIVIPPDFADKLIHGGASVLLLIDGSSSYTSQAASQSANAISQQYAVKLLGQNASPLNAHVSVLYNPDMKDLLFVVPGMIGFIMYGIALKLTAFAIVREREVGTMEAILVTPIRPIELMLAKTIPNLTIAFANTVAALAVAMWIFHIPFRGNLLLFFGLAILFSFAGLGLGIAISSISQTQMQANQIATLFNLVAMFLAGVMFPVYSLPLLLRLLSYLFPLTYFVPITNGIFIKGVGLQALWPEVLALLAIIILIFIVGARFFKQRLD